ncbi:hypothetical protein [Fervidibacillus albus]|uniref:Rho termination factor N-terminal domain-containing protein n=1 Tax=Fervidibacillus albus TaxID=2980026 RepID=A0A9E8RX16_9BACI|nr:hypothetical protein [Fervidibacillus albus]WAA10829.1 hypothetical protein OE104_05820 [Fervidibacillus albus]
MLKPIRKTLSGQIEYWDTERKLVVIGGSDLASNIINIESDISLEELNANQLRSFAEQNGIDIPGNMKKEETIRSYIIEKLKTAVDSE